jgi:ATP-binding cassette subfamily B protein
MKLSFTNLFSNKNHSQSKGFTLQQGQSDCGVACLLSILRFHGGEMKLERLRELSGTDKQGTTLLGLFQAANQVGFTAEGMEAESIDNLKELSTPAILHVVLEGKMEHYLVFYPNLNNLGGKKTLTIGDPAKGIIEYSVEELNKIWQTKAFLMLIPNEHLKQVSEEQQQKKGWFLNIVRPDFTILGIASIMGVIIASLGISTAVFSQRLIDDILPKQDTKRLILGLVLLFILLLARSFMSYLRGFLLNRQSQGFNNLIIDGFYSSLLSLPKSFFDNRKTGELIARMNDTRRIQQTVSFLTGNVLINLLVLIASSIYVFTISVSIGLVALASIPLFGGLVWFFNKKIIRQQKEVMASYAQNESNYIDTIQGIEVIKASNKEPFFTNLTKVIYGVFQTKVYNLGKLSLHFGLLGEIISVVLLVGMISCASWLVITKTLKIGEMMAILSIAGNIIPAVSALAMTNIQLQEAKVAFDRMFEFVNIETEPRLRSVPNGSEFLNLEIKNLSFRFVGRKLLLKNISLNVKKGEMIALWGESGSGKSTLIQIIQRFYEVDSGKIVVNSEDWNKIDTKAWRDILGVVPQQTKLFNGTLLDNICLENTQEEAKKVIEFCESYKFSQFFEDFPQGYLTILGEEGINISGGQRQLVALARALYRNPQLLLLDEATSAMDRITEKFILQLLHKIRNEMAIIMVTHKPQTARIADRIYIIENGEIINSGSHKQLSTTNNIYNEAWMELI